MTHGDGRKQIAIAYLFLILMLKERQDVHHVTFDEHSYITVYIK